MDNSPPGASSRRYNQEYGFLSLISPAGGGGGERNGEAECDKGSHGGPSQSNGPGETESETKHDLGAHYLVQ